MAVSIPATDSARAIKLSVGEHRRGIAVLMSLQTVRTALRFDDATVVQLIARNVIKNEQAHVEFSKFIRKTAGYEVSDQRRVVAYLLPECFILQEDLVQKHRRKKKLEATAAS